MIARVRRNGASVVGLPRIAPLLACAWLMAFAPAASALTFADQRFTCPVGGETFTQRLPASGTAFGVQLDMKPFGPMAAPWPLPVCPGNGFVLYKPAEAFDAGELERLAAYVASDAYRALAADDTPYYRAAMLIRVAEGADAAVAQVLLQATWEAQGDPRYPRYAEAALAAYRDDSTPTAPYTKPLLIGELLRRLSRFDEAEAEFAAVDAALDAEQHADSLVRAIVRYQRELVARRDAQPHPVPEVPEDEEVPESASASPDCPDGLRSAAEMAALEAEAMAAAEAAAQAARDAQAREAAEAGSDEAPP